MNNFPKGNDLIVKWAIKYSDGTPFPLENYAWELCYSAGRGINVVKDTAVISVSDNLLTWRFSGKDQAFYGKYSLTLRLYQQGKIVATVRKNNAFELSTTQYDGPCDIDLVSYCDNISLQDALLRGNRAMEVAQGAKDIAGSAVNTAAGAVTTANEAKNIASTANNTSTEAKTIANNAKTVADQAKATADATAATATQKAEEVAQKEAQLEAALNNLSTDQSGALALSTKVNDHGEKLTELVEKVNGKQDALTLTVKDNGNIVLANIQGQSKEFMPATPSGDPMHYAYEAVGAVWNSTGSDIVKTAPWAELADDDADKVVIHKAGHWYLNGLGDLTNDDMRLVYFSLPFNGSYIQGRYYNESTRTIVCATNIASSFINIPMRVMFRNSKIEVFGNNLSNTLNVNDDMLFAFAFSNIKAILYTISLSSVKVSSEFSPFGVVYSLKYVKLKRLNNSISMIACSLLSSRSILYMIQNENATSAITITLHADAYARAMANADILAALEAHPNVSLASA